MWHQQHLLQALLGAGRAASTSCICLMHPTRCLQQPTHLCACVQGSDYGQAIATMLLDHEEVRAAFDAERVPPKHREWAQVGSSLLCTGLQA